MTLLKQVALENGAAVVMATHDYHMIQNFPVKPSDVKTEKFLYWILQNF
jgi:ABC-type lipoprotein export system ATPase subunit